MNALRSLGRPGAAKFLAKRTLTILYNTRPSWLELAHRQLDEVVFAAYGWDASMSDVAILEGLLALNLEREAAQAGSQAEDNEDSDDDEELEEPEE